MIDYFAKRKYEIITDILRIYTGCSPDLFPVFSRAKFSVPFLPACDEKYGNPRSDRWMLVRAQLWQYE